MSRPHLRLIAPIDTPAARMARAADAIAAARAAIPPHLPGAAGLCTDVSAVLAQQERRLRAAIAGTNPSGPEAA